MLRVWMEKESSLGVLGLQKSKSTDSSPPPPTPTPNPQNLPKVAETTCAGTRRSPTTYTRKHELSEFTLTLKQEVAAKAVSDSEKNRHCLRG